jgi:hypothetical protein
MRSIFLRGGFRPQLNFPKGALFHGVKIEGLKKMKAGEIYYEEDFDCRRQ